jgi:lipoprotein-releasing system permease protein
VKNVFETFVALRYLRDRSARREGRGFVRFVIAVGVGGVAVGVAALLLALSIVHGFSREIRDKIEGLGAHLQVESQTDAPLRNAGEIISGIQAIDGIDEVRPALDDFVLIRRSASDIDGVVGSGVKQLPDYISDHLIDGSSSLDGGRGIFVGRALALAQGLAVGERVTVFAFTGSRSSSGAVSRPRIRQYQVAGIYETGREDFDETGVFADFESAVDLFGYEEDTVSRLDVSVRDGFDRVMLREEIESRFGFPVMVRTIEEVRSSLFAWIRLQESIIPVVIGFIVLVAIFNIGGILLMIVMEKTRSIGVMVSMGAARRSIRNLVLTLSGLIGVAGVLLGSGMALVLALVQQKYDVMPLPADAYYMSTAPVELQFADFVVVAMATLTLCLLFAYIPARFAARMDPIRVIRFE